MKKIKESTKESKPFFSSLYDTVKVRLQLQHPRLRELAESNRNVRFRHDGFRVDSKFKGIRARLGSEKGCANLVIEGSIPKFLTGQNVVGSEDLTVAVIEFIDEVLKRAGICPTKAERRRYREGTFELLRVCYVTHTDLAREKRIPC
jgi:II/X family phage/plasmid replication protein